MQNDTTRDRILELAAELFATKGFDATTTRELTDALDITPAALYYHFDSKMACLEALVDPYLGRVEALVAETDGPLSTRRQAQVFLRALGDLMSRSPRVAAIVETDPALRNHPRLAPRIEAMHDQLRRVLAGPQPEQLDLIRASSALGALVRPRLRLGRDVDDVAVAAALDALGENG